MGALQPTWKKGWMLVSIFCSLQRSVLDLCLPFPSLCCLHSSHFCKQEFWNFLTDSATSFSSRSNEITFDACNLNPNRSLGYLQTGILSPFLHAKQWNCFCILILPGLETWVHQLQYCTVDHWQIDHWKKDYKFGFGMTVGQWPLLLLKPTSTLMKWEPNLPFPALWHWAAISLCHWCPFVLDMFLPNRLEHSSQSCG